MKVPVKLNSDGAIKLEAKSFGWAKLSTANVPGFNIIAPKDGWIYFVKGPANGEKYALVFKPADQFPGHSDFDNHTVHGMIFRDVIEERDINKDLITGILDRYFNEAADERNISVEEAAIVGEENETQLESYYSIIKKQDGAYKITRNDGAETTEPFDQYAQRIITAWKETGTANNGDIDDDGIPIPRENYACIQVREGQALLNTLLGEVSIAFYYVWGRQNPGRPGTVVSNPFEHELYLFDTAEYLKNLWHNQKISFYPSSTQGDGWTPAEPGGPLDIFYPVFNSSSGHHITISDSFQQLRVSFQLPNRGRTFVVPWRFSYDMHREDEVGKLEDVFLDVFLGGAWGTQISFYFEIKNEQSFTSFIKKENTYFIPAPAGGLPSRMLLGVKDIDRDREYKFRFHYDDSVYDKILNKINEIYTEKENYKKALDDLRQSPYAPEDVLKLYFLSDSLSKAMHQGPFKANAGVNSMLRLMEDSLFVRQSLLNELASLVASKTYTQALRNRPGVSRLAFDTFARSVLFENRGVERSFFDRHFNVACGHGVGKLPGYLIDGLDGSSEVRNAVLTFIESLLVQRFDVKAGSYADFFDGKKYSLSTLFDYAVPNGEGNLKIMIKGTEVFSTLASTINLAQAAKKAYDNFSKTGDHEFGALNAIKATLDLGEGLLSSLELVRSTPGNWTADSIAEYSKPLKNIGLGLSVLTNILSIYEASTKYYYYQSAGNDEAQLGINLQRIGSVGQIAAGFIIAFTPLGAIGWTTMIVGGIIPSAIGSVMEDNTRLNMNTFLPSAGEFLHKNSIAAGADKYRKPPWAENIRNQISIAMSYVYPITPAKFQHEGSVEGHDKRGNPFPGIFVCIDDQISVKKYIMFSFEFNHPSGADSVFYIGFYIYYKKDLTQDFNVCSVLSTVDPGNFQPTNIESCQEIASGSDTVTAFDKSGHRYSVTLQLSENSYEYDYKKIRIAASLEAFNSTPPDMPASLNDDRGTVITSRLEAEIINHEIYKPEQYR